MITYSENRLKMVGVRLESSVVEELNLRAVESGISVSRVARKLIEEALFGMTSADVQILDLLKQIKNLTEASVNLSALTVGVSSIPLHATDTEIANIKQLTANHIINGHDIGLAVRQKLEKTMDFVISKDLTFNKKIARM